MQHMQVLDQQSIKTKLESLTEWSEIQGSIQRTYKFNDFLESIAFVSKVADLAESRQHHPDILIRYNKVTLTLSTHDAGGITEKDFDLATASDALA
jgi:4a-hydroxytetrahydrobiopterin dehydratase